MKKQLLYLLLVLFFAGATAFVLFRSSANNDLQKLTRYELLQRKGPSATTEEWTRTQQQAKKLLAASKASPADTKTALSLANLFIMEARATGNYAYYDQAAMHAIDRVLSKEPNNFDGLVLKSLVQLSQHHFSDALAVAQQAQKINPYNAFLYGLLVDAHVEMGNYDSAVLSAEKMMEIRPDLRSYARVSYLREIFGDYPGAINAMELAIDAGAPGDESTEWSRVQLGKLYEQTGNLTAAKASYNAALHLRPGYVPAMAGLGRIATSGQDYATALQWYLQADSLVNDFAIKGELIDVYQLAGDAATSKAISNQVITSMADNARAAATDETIGHYADGELALAYVRMGDYNKALEHALAEYNRRPNNIEVNETLAWVYYQQSNYPKAGTHMQAALKTNSRNPVLLARAGLIFSKEGDQQKAKKLLKEALAMGASLPVYLQQPCELALKAITI